MIVADTNLLAYLLVGGPRTEAARAVFRRDPDWAAPYLWRSELRSVLGQYLSRGECSLAEALELMERAELLLRGREFLVGSEAVLRLVTDTGCSAYDAEFVALARRLSVSLVTVDREILETFPRVAWSPEDFLGDPA